GTAMISANDQYRDTDSVLRFFKAIGADPQAVGEAKLLNDDSLQRMAAERIQSAPAQTGTVDAKAQIATEILEEKATEAQTAKFSLGQRVQATSAPKTDLYVRRIEKSPSSTKYIVINLEKSVEE